MHKYACDCNEYALWPGVAIYLSDKNNLWLLLPDNILGYSIVVIVAEKIIYDVIMTPPQVLFIESVYI